jgi:hypothetical protein
MGPLSHIGSHLPDCGSHFPKLGPFEKAEETCTSPPIPQAMGTGYAPDPFWKIANGLQEPFLLPFTSFSLLLVATGCTSLGGEIGEKIIQKL